MPAEPEEVVLHLTEVTPGDYGTLQVFGHAFPTYVSPEDENIPLLKAEDLVGPHVRSADAPKPPRRPAPPKPPMKPSRFDPLQPKADGETQ